LHLLLFFIYNYGYNYLSYLIEITLGKGNYGTVVG
jgi:hypothetical protein